MVMKTRDETFTIEELTGIARKFLWDNYGLTLEIPIQKNNRLRRAMGRYMATWEDEPLRIEIAGFMFEHAHPSVIISTLKHECIHYAMHVKDEPYSDGHPHFEAELRKHGANSTGEVLVGVNYRYACDRCGEVEHTRYVKVLKNPGYYRSPCCNAALINVKKVILNGIGTEKEAIT